MHATFTDNLAEAEKTEKSSQATFDTLKKAKEGMLASTTDALTNLVKEHGARALTKEEAKKEIKDLEDQMTADQGFIDAVEKAHEAKAKEWETRKGLRQQEIAA